MRFMNIPLIKQWIRKNAPNGNTKLAAAVGTSVSTINQIINENHEPGTAIVRNLAHVIGVRTDDIIFPVNPFLEGSQSSMGSLEAHSSRRSQAV